MEVDEKSSTLDIGSIWPTSLLPGGIVLSSLRRRLSFLGQATFITRRQIVKLD
jgi:hypothetical protein